MSCMKCGRDLEEGQVFCASCLEDMAKYPVKPGTAVQLHHRKDLASAKKTGTKRKQTVSPEERIRKLKKGILSLVILWLITLALLTLTVYPTVEYFSGNRFLLPGQNYTTVTSSDTTTP